MPSFAYRATDAKGQAKAGRIEAATAPVARAMLRAQGLVLLAIDAAEAAPAAKAQATPLRQRQTGLPLKTLTLLTRQLATLLSSGLRVDEALAVVGRSHDSKTAALLDAIRKSLTEGRSLADAMAPYPRAFSGEYAASVRAGEQSGKLASVLEHLAGMVETRAQNRQTLSMAMAYPALLVVVSVTIITMLMIFVVPDIVRVFAARDAALPFLTRALIGLSGFLRDWGIGLLVGAGLGLAASLRLLRRPAVRLALHRRSLGLPLIGTILHKSNAAQFAASLSTLLHSGVSLVEALHAAAAATPNLYIRSRIAGVLQSVKEGVSLSTAMTEAGCFPAMLLAMVESGEANGRIGFALGHAARDQQRDVDAWVKMAVALVEPAILLLMGGVVMLIVLAIMLPLISMNSLVGV